MTFFGFSSEEEIREHMDKVEMAADEYNHALERIWRSLSNDDLLTMGRFFHEMCHSESGIIHLAMTSGRLLQLRAERSNTCVLDGKDHDAELSDMAGKPKENTPQPEDLSPTSDTSDDPLTDWVDNGLGTDPRTQKAVDTAEQMKTYRMEWVNVEPDSKESPLLRCKDCHQHYPSLKDRMLREPGIEGCAGCIHKAKWG